MIKIARITLVVCLALAVSEQSAVAEQSLEMTSALLKIVQSVDIAAATSGVLTELIPREGAIVEKGSLIASIELRAAELKAKRAAVELDVARKQSENDVDVRYATKAHAVAVAELGRAEEINRSIANSISLREIDRLRLIVERTRLEIEQAQHKTAVFLLEQQLKETELEIAQHELDQHTVSAPIGGMVVHVEKEPGEWVIPGDLVVRVVRIDRLRAEGFLHVSQASQDLRGKSVTVSVEVPGSSPMTADGRVVFVSPDANAVNGQARVWVEVQNEDGKLRPGLRATVHIHMEREPQAEE